MQGIITLIAERLPEISRAVDKEIAIDVGIKVRVWIRNIEMPEQPLIIYIFLAFEVEQKDAIQIKTDF